jgi:membrane-associated phospholipid phosphatase
MARCGRAANFSSQDDIAPSLAIWIFICQRNTYTRRMVAPRKLRWSTLLWLLAGGAVLTLAFLLDNRAEAALDATRNPELKKFAGWCSKIGEGWVPVVAGFFFAAVFLIVKRPGVAAKIFFVMLTCSLTGLAATILRGLLGRTRPLNHDVPQGFYGVWHDGHWLIGKFAYNSFPSGHAGTVAGLAAAAWLVHRGWGAVAMLYAVAVMWSRIALQYHHLSDVVASTLLSIVLARWAQKYLLTSVEFQFGNLHRAWRNK